MCILIYERNINLYKYKIYNCKKKSKCVKLYLCVLCVKTKGCRMHNSDVISIMDCAFDCPRFCTYGV